MYVDISLYNGAPATQRLTMSRWPVYIFIPILSAAALFQPDKTAANNQIIPNPGRQDSSIQTTCMKGSLEAKLNMKHCQRHNGPEGWVHITESRLIKHQLQNLNQASASRLNVKLKPWPNIASESWPRFNFVTSTKHQQPTSESWPNLVLKVWTKV